jgi:hypothetical protein
MDSPGSHPCFGHGYRLVRFSVLWKEAKMKFIALLISFQVVGPNTNLTDKVRHQFDWKYFKVSQIEEIRKGFQIHYKIDPLIFEDICEISLDDGHIVDVLQSCDSLINGINKL